MAEVEVLLREYGYEVNDRCPPITVVELERHLESAAVDERGGDDLTVGYLRRRDGAASPAQRTRLLGAVAATVLAVMGIVVVADRINGDNTTDVSSVSSPTELDSSSGVADSLASREWSRVPHDEDVFGGSAMRDVTVAGPGLVAVGATAGTEDPLGPVTADTAAVVWTSTDGITWSRVPHDEAVFGGAGMHAVTAHRDGLVAIGFDSDGYPGAVVWTSSDGITWSRLPHDETVFGGANMWDLIVGGPGLVAVGAGDSGPVVWTSTNGTTWARVPHDEAAFGAADSGMFRVTAGGPGLVAVGWDFSMDAAAAAVWTSTDGITWARVPHDEAVFGGEEQTIMIGVTAHGNGLVAVGEATTNGNRGAAVWTSTDGIAWARMPHDETVFGGAFMLDVTAVGPLLVAAGESGSDMAVWTSFDGVGWTRVVDNEVVSGRSALLGVTVGGPGLVAVGWDQSRGDSVAAVWRN
jgi:hypothetical protein